MEWKKLGAKDAVRTAVRFPLQLALHLKTEDGVVDTTTRDISSSGILFACPSLPRIGSNIEFTMDMPSDLMGWVNDISIHCMGRVVRYQCTGQETMLAAIIDDYFLKA